MAATNAQPPPTGQPQGSSAGDSELATNDEVKEYCHEGEGENTEHLNSMDLHDIKTELEKDAEEAETPKIPPTTSTDPVSFNTSPNTSVTSHVLPFRPTVVQPMVYTANGFMVPPFAAGTPLYPVTAGIRPVKMEIPGSTTDWAKAATQGISIPYGYSTSFLPVDQGLRPTTYPFLMPGQYVAQMSYPQQLSSFGTPVAPNATVQPNSGIIAPQQKDKKPHIKKPLNAFMLFMKEKRAEVIKECTLKESAAINQILGKKWHQLDKSEQAKYYEMAREERAKHMQMYPGWSARDNYAIHKKRRKKRQKQQQDSDNADVEEGNLNESAASKRPKLEEDNPDNPRKCRARYGIDQQHMWCGPCRRKKKCIRADDDDDNDKSQTKDSIDEIEDNKTDIVSLTTSINGSSH